MFVINFCILLFIHIYTRKSVYEGDPKNPEFNYIFKKFLKRLNFQREGEGERKRGKETSRCGCFLHAPIGDLACNPGMCPDWESNQQPFGSQAGTQSTELHQPGLPFSPLIPPTPQQSPHCSPCPRVLFPFCSIPPSHLPLTSCHPALYESVPIFLISPVSSLDSTYE